MPKHIGEFVYEFEGELFYSHGGERKLAATITVKAPNGRVRPYIATIDAELQKALLGIEDRRSNTQAKEEDVKAAGEKIQEKIKEDKQEEYTLAVGILSAGGGDLQKCLLATEDILKAGNSNNAVALLDGVEKVTDPRLKDMQYTDLKNILGGMLVNFLNIFPQS